MERDELRELLEEVDRSRGCLALPDSVSVLVLVLCELCELCKLCELRELLEEVDRPRGCLALPNSVSVLVLVLRVGLESGGDELLSPCDSSLDGKFEWLTEEEP